MGSEGRTDVLFSPLCFANLLDHMSFQLSAFYVDSGLSFFKGKVGSTVGSDRVTLLDDGTGRTAWGRCAMMRKVLPHAGPR
jgi:predicted Zn-dependent protease